MVETLGDRLRRLRIAAGLTIEQLAAAAGIGFTSLQRYETHRNSPTAVQLAKIAAALGLPQGALMPDGDVAYPPGAARAPRVHEADTDQPRDLHTVALPLYESIPAGGWSPGAPERAGDFHVLHHLVRDTEVVVRVRGDSMYPDFRDGDLVLVDISRTKPRSGEPIIAIFRGETTFKRFRVVHRQPVLVPDNPSFPPLEVSDLDDLQVLGIVKRIVDRDVSKAVR